MIRPLRISQLLPLFFLLGSCSALWAQSVQQIAEAVDSHYNHLRTLQAEFTEVYKGAGVERTETGTLWLKKPGKMRWEYRSPKEKLFLSDGKDAWLYLPDQHQVRKMTLKKLEDLRSPIAFLLGKTNLRKELAGLSIAPDQTPVSAGNVVLRGVPKAMADRVEQVILEITPQHQIVRIQIQEVDEATTEYRFRDLREDAPLTDSSFRFSSPAGVETIQGEIGQ
ncbi:MAG TPA: outer membrane lipoprotein chaperone LolA [Terriglobales bacterium]|nr:outer membrane lipoprotein chaperone LolA [Terriglobales bacterium]